MRTERVDGARVLIWSGVRIYRDGLCAALEADPRIGKVAAVADAVECRRVLDTIVPEVLVLDALADGALDVARFVRDGRTGVVALGVAEAEPLVVALAEAGVSAYVTREQPLETLIGSIVAVASGEARCTHKIAGILLRHVASVADAREERARHRVRLTRREAEILSLVADGLTNKEIALRLSIGLPTVKNHVHKILEKLDVQSRAQAVAVTTGASPLVSIGV